MKRLGLKTEIFFAGDIDKNCKATYFANYDIKEENWNTDIHHTKERLIYSLVVHRFRHSQ